ncbi:hypothetical protein QAD02_017166 [Eretmocerus hayati]|uniref:Uncharacterized protein n=1 Tax=Eretmocerus hayati TaxID=131215 RepID=A0ACC2PFP2_9HYME|nr:hypothetical protein QAD02_017166 [Eretmocerus hayati]
MQAKWKLIRDRVTSYIRKAKENEKPLRSECLAYQKCQWLLKHLGKTKDRTGGASEYQPSMPCRLAAMESCEPSTVHGYLDLMLDGSTSGGCNGSFTGQVEALSRSKPPQEASVQITPNDNFQPKEPDTVDTQMKSLVEQICSGYEDGAGKCDFLPKFPEPVDLDFPKRPKVSNSSLQAENDDPIQDNLLPKFAAQIAELGEDEEAIEVAGTIWDHYRILDDNLKAVALAEILDILQSFVKGKKGPYSGISAEGLFSHFMRLYFFAFEQCNACLYVIRLN